MGELIYLNSTGAIGDAVISTGLIPSLHEAGYDQVHLITRSHVCPLWKGIQNAEALPSDKVQERLPVIDISGYLANQFKPECYDLHLVELQAVEIKNQRGPEIFPTPDDVGLVLTKEELEEGARKINEISNENGGLPIVIFAPYSTTKNRNLPMNTLQTVVAGLSGNVASCILQPPETGDLISKATTILEWDLRRTAALLAAVDAVVAIESAQAHMVNGVLQGSKDVMDRLGLNKRQDKVVVVLGSGPKSAVVYGSDYENQVITREKSVCDIFCRAHGYSGQTETLRKIYPRKDFYSSDNEGDKSLCQFPDYPHIETARCMQSIDPNKIIETVLKVVKTF